MKITKLEHSGLILEKNNRKIVFDPVQFAETLPELNSVVAIIVTHIHADHFQPEIIRKILELNPDARVFAPENLDLGVANFTLATDSDILDIEGFNLRFFGEDHASIFTGKVPCRNIGVVVDDLVLNPGDSFDLPESAQQIPVLLAPEVAPWAKISESIDFIEKVKPKYIIPMHDGLLSKMGKNIYDNFLKNVCENIGAKFLALGPNDSFEIDT